MADERNKDSIQKLLQTLSDSAAKQLGERQSSGSTSPNVSTYIDAFAGHVSGRYYKDQTITLDGYSFHNCCFHNCVVITNNGLFSLTNCTFINVRTSFGPLAVRIIKLFQMAAGTRSGMSTFDPEVAEDGAITVR